MYRDGNGNKYRPSKIVKIDGKVIEIYFGVNDSSGATPKISSSGVSDKTKDKTNRYIIVCDTIFDDMPKTVQETILWHEKAHIILGHCDYLCKIPVRKKKLIYNGLTDISHNMEYCADLFAAERIGYQKVKTSLYYLYSNYGHMSKSFLSNMIARHELKMRINNICKKY